jgi:phenylalanyl-tRNA synthetase alpha chain
MAYVNCVKDVHLHAGYNSIGYGYDWSVEGTEEPILCTHPIPLSSDILYRLAQETKANGALSTVTKKVTAIQLAKFR